MWFNHSIPPPPPQPTGVIMIQVPLNEQKTQRSITLPDRLWALLLQVGEGSYSKGARIVLEEVYSNLKSKMEADNG
jgi:hypothetical protein